MTKWFAVHILLLNISVCLELQGRPTGCSSEILALIKQSVLQYYILKLLWSASPQSAPW